MSSYPTRQSFGNMLILLAAVVIILTSMSRAASILNPMLFAIVMSLIVSPIYQVLKRRRVPTPLALLMMVILTIGVFGFLVYLTSTAFARFTARTAEYTALLDGRLAEWEGVLDLGAFFSSTELIGLIEVILAAIASFLGSSVFIIMLILFFLAEGEALMARLSASVANQERVQYVKTFGQSVIRQFGLRAIVNLVTGIFFAIFLFVLGVDFPLLWGTLTFFLSYIPYLGIVLAAIPAVILALAEFGVMRALLVIVGVTVANVSAENILAPMLMSRGLQISPTVVFVSFALWTWLLGAPGAFLAMPLTLFLLLVLEMYPETRWLAQVMSTESEAQEESATQG